MERLQVLCDRVTALEPQNAEAYHWKAKLYAVRGLAVRDSEVVMAFVDLAEAIRFARRAVDLAPETLSYREALAEYLVLKDQDAEAMELMSGVSGGQHPLFLLLRDRTSLPRHAAATLLVRETEERVREAVARGWQVDYPHLRIQQFVLPITAQELTTFYRDSWPQFQFFKVQHQEMGSASITHWVQWVRLRANETYPATDRDEIPVPAQPPEGIILALSEFRNVPHAPFPVPVGDVFSIMTVRNYRPSPNR